MNSTFVSFAWMLSIVGLVAWLLAGGAILRGRLATRPPTLWTRRLLWIPAWLLCGIGGFWGIPVHESTKSTFAQLDAIPPISETTRSELRTPFIVRIGLHTRGFDGQLIESEELSYIQLPVALILFLGAFFFTKQRKLQSDAFVTPGKVALVLAAVSVSGCAPTPGEASRPDRVIAEVQWDTLFLVESLTEDSLLFRLDRLGGDEDGFSVLDGVAHRIARFDWDGGLRWYAGRKGGGPGELQQPRDLRSDESGTTWVLDVVSRRITGYDSSGSLFDEVPLTELPGSLHEFAVAPGAESFFAVIPEDGAMQVVEFDRRGSVLESSRIVISRRGEPRAMALQGKIGFHSGQNRWSYAFSVGDGLFRFERANQIGEWSLFPVPVPFPEVTEEVTRSGASTVRTSRMSRTYGAVAAAVSEERAYVLLLDEDRRYRLLDVYDLGTGGYLETLRLPHQAAAVMVEGDRLLLGYNSPHPTVLALSLESRRGN